MGGADFGLDKMASNYRDQKSGLNEDDYDHKLKTTSTLYVGNLSFYTTEEQMYELFTMAGEVKRVIMGLDRVKRTPCGFCFVEYYNRNDATNAINFINGTKLDSRIIRTDWDIGFQEGRQYGRGKSGGQVRDEYRMDYDEDRGGFGWRAQNITREFHGLEGEKMTSKNEIEEENMQT